MMLAMLASCSSHDDAETLLATVPEDATVVSVFNLENIMRNLDIKQKEGALEFPEYLAGNMPDEAKKILATDCGVRYTFGVMYMQGANVCITFMLDDAEAFGKAVEKTLKGGQQIMQNSGEDLKYTENGSVFWSDRQAWFTDAYSVRDFKDMVAPAEKVSVLNGVPEFSSMVPLDRDIAFYVNNEEMMSYVGRDLYAEQAMAASLMQGFLSKDMTYTGGWAELSKDKIVAELQVYNRKGQPSQGALHLDKIDTRLLQRHLTDSEIIVAISLPQSVVRQILDNLPSALGNLGPARQLLEGIDGTLAIGCNTKGSKLESFIITTTGADAAAAIKEAAGNGPDMGKLSIEDRYLVAIVGDNLPKVQAKRIDPFKDYGIAVSMVNRENNYSLFAGIDLEKMKMKAVLEGDLTRMLK